MRVANGKWFIASRDIYRASCNHCIMLSMAVAAKSTWALEQIRGFEESSEKIQFYQGYQFEALRFEELKQSLPEGDFIEIEGKYNSADTNEALSKGIPVVAQAYLEIDYGVATLTGYADLLVREDYELVYVDGKLHATKLNPDSTATKYVPYDIKHSNEVKENYWHQVGGYLEALQGMKLASTRDVGVVTKHSIHNKPAQVVLDELKEAREPLILALISHSPDEAKELKHFSLQCKDPVTCGKIFCEYPKLCIHDRIENDMLTQMYNNARASAETLSLNGINTVEELMNMPTNMLEPEFTPEQIEALITEATVITNEKQGKEPRVVKKQYASMTIPAPSQGDLFFDLEWLVPILSDRQLNYIFGTVDSAGTFKYFEAHDFDQEKQAFQDFVQYCLDRIKTYPDMHIYHWTSPEVRGLTKLAENQGILAEEVKQIQSHMIDLQPIAKDRLWVGVGGYSLKQLERYYQLNRETDTADGADSMVQYFKYQAAIKNNNHEEAARILKDIFDYNKADCVSTLEACKWLRTFD